VADDDIVAFKCLQQRYAPFLKQFFVIRGVDSNSADDLVQKIFTCLWEQRKNYRVLSSFDVYLFSMARNALYNEIRQSRSIAELNSKKHPESDVDTNNMLSQPEAELFFQELTDAI
jgi:RNA polymerase sigma factor (sigma-70 family)